MHLCAGRHAAADGAGVLQDDLLYVLVGADLATLLHGGGGERPADRAHAAAGIAPGADRAVDLAHVVVQQHIGRAGRVGSEGGADERTAGQVALHHVGLAIFVEEDRKSVVWGKSVSGRVTLGGRRILNKKTTNKTPKK